MKQKKLMLLGGLRYLLPVIDAAHKMGIYVITADYLPNNIAHKYSDEYVNVSIIDKEAVLKVAKEKQIDGIMSFAVDPGVVTAAFVAEQMKLPFQCSYEAACILQDKFRFRKFLMDNGFNCPQAKGYDNVEDALKDVDLFTWPVIVKPVDSAGSKGVTKVENVEDLEDAIANALCMSHNGHFIIEEYMESDGSPVGSESFVVDGRLLYNGFYDQCFDTESSNPFVPFAECWPSVLNQVHQKDIKSELQRLMNLLGVKSGLFNVESRVCKDGKAYLMEVSPRAGGNRLAEMLNYAADVNIIEAELRQSLCMSQLDIHEPHYKGHYAVVVLHSYKEGLFNHIEIDSQFRKNHVLEEDVLVNKGQHVLPFTGANTSIGTLFLRFETRAELDDALEHQERWLTIDVD